MCLPAWQLWVHLWICTYLLNSEFCVDMNNSVRTPYFRFWNIAVLCFIASLGPWVLYKWLFRSCNRGSNNNFDLLVRQCQQPTWAACQSRCHIFCYLSTICLTPVMFWVQHKYSLLDMSPWLTPILYVILCFTSVYSVITYSLRLLIYVSSMIYLDIF
jgi:hypothetical protein